MSLYTETTQERHIRCAKGNLAAHEQAHADAKAATDTIVKALEELGAGVRYADNAKVRAECVRSRSIYRKAFDEACGTESAAAEDVRNSKAIVNSLCNDYDWYTAEWTDK